MANESEIIDIRSTHYQRLYETDQTLSTLTTVIELISRPTPVLNALGVYVPQDGYMDMAGSTDPGYNIRPNIPSALKLIFWGVGTAAQTFQCKIWGLRRVVPRVTGVTVSYLRVPLALITCTLGTGTGVSGGLLGTGVKGVSAIALATGYNANVGIEVVSPADNTLAHVIVVTKGEPLLQAEIAISGGGATSGNGAWSEL